jgi:hypothetical protein
MNLKPKNKERGGILSHKLIVIYIALALVLLINQIVFSVILKEREKARAISASYLADMAYTLPSQTINKGTNNVVLAEFWLPDALATSAVACNYNLAGNPCVTMVDADGTGSAGAGTDDDGAVNLWKLIPLGPNSASFSFQASDGVCTDNLSTPTCVYVDSDDDCNATTGTQTYLIGSSCGKAVDINVSTSSLPALWVHSELVNPNGAYDYGSNTANTETIWILKHQADNVLVQGLNWNSPYTNQWQGDSAGTWTPLGNVNGEGFIDEGNDVFDGGEPVIIDVDNSRTYTVGDIDVYSRTGGPAGEPLTDLSTALGPNGKHLIYANAGGAGGLDGNDTILEDTGNIQTGADNNGFIDRQGDTVNAATFQIFGTAIPNVDYTNLRIYLDLGVGLGGDNYCDSHDFGPTALSYDGTYWDTGALNGSFPNPFLVCVVADIPATARPGKTIRFGLPQLVDANANGLYDVGDTGYFLFSTNDGPIGGSYQVPYTITIGSTQSYGSRPADNVPPGPVTNVKVKANAMGSVSIIWQDPPDADLSQIIITEEDLAGRSNDSIVNKGIQNLSLTGRKVGEAYQYTIRAADASGNLSVSQVYAVTIPKEGEIEITSPVYLPSPLMPSLPEGINIGDSIKTADSPDIYAIGVDKEKHKFPNEVIYSSWYKDYANVKIVSNEIMEGIKTGTDVYLRPGTYLVRKSGTQEIYAPDADGVLVRISSERILQTLYGLKWSERVIELPGELFRKYIIGPTLVSPTHPNGCLISYRNSKTIYYIKDGIKHEVSKDAFEKSHFQDRFVIKNVDATISYSSGNPLKAIDEIGYLLR